MLLYVVQYAGKTGNIDTLFLQWISGTATSFYRKLEQDIFYSVPFIQATQL